MEKKRGFTLIDPNIITPNPFQPRRTFDPLEMSNLVDSIREKGVLQPVIVRTKDDRFELVVGERRWRAVKKLKLDAIPAIIKEMNDRDMLEMAIIENIQREDLNPIEKANAYIQLINEFGLTHDELARRLGQDRSSVSNTLRLLKLPNVIKEGITHKILTMGQARSLLSLKSNDEQIQMYKRITQSSMSVRDVEGLVADIQIHKGITPKKAAKSLKKKDPQFVFLESELGEALGTKVILKGNNKKGHLEIYYYSLDDLDRLIKRIRPKSKV